MEKKPRWMFTSLILSSIIAISCASSSNLSQKVKTSFFPYVSQFEPPYTEHSIYNELVFNVCYIGNDSICFLYENDMEEYTFRVVLCNRKMSDYCATQWIPVYEFFPEVFEDLNLINRIIKKSHVVGNDYILTDGTDKKISFPFESFDFY